MQVNSFFFTYVVYDLPYMDWTVVYKKPNVPKSQLNVLRAVCKKIFLFFLFIKEVLHLISDLSSFV